MWQQTIIACVLFMTLWAFLWFSLAQLIKRNDIADIAWGLGFVAACLVTSYTATGEVLPQTLPGILVLSFVLIWGLRLSFHIFMRNRGKAEDYRYQQWRKEWGIWFLPRSFAQVFLLQAYLAIIVVSPALAVLQNTNAETTLLVGVGSLVWLFGFLFEAVADAQLKDFLSRKKSPEQIITAGLWKYSRHPNYFGEITQWWGIYILAVGAVGAWGAILGPVAITFLITKVSGIPLLEKKMLQNPKYVTYAKKTSALVPWFVK